MMAARELKKENKKVRINTKNLAVVAQNRQWRFQDAQKTNRRKILKNKESET